MPLFCLLVNSGSFLYDRQTLFPCDPTLSTISPIVSLFPLFIPLDDNYILSFLIPFTWHLLNLLHYLSFFLSLNMFLSLPFSFHLYLRPLYSLNISLPLAISLILSQMKEASCLICNRIKKFQIQYLQHSVIELEFFFKSSLSFNYKLCLSPQICCFMLFQTSDCM